jgi:hypothetical protein
MESVEVRIGYVLRPKAAHNCRYIEEEEHHNSIIFDLTHTYAALY